MLAVGAAMMGGLIAIDSAGDSVQDGHRTAWGWVMVVGLAVSAGAAFNLFMWEEA